MRSGITWPSNDSALRPALLARHFGLHQRTHNPQSSCSGREPASSSRSLRSCSLRLCSLSRRSTATSPILQHDNTIRTTVICFCNLTVYSAERISRRGVATTIHHLSHRVHIFVECNSLFRRCLLDSCAVARANYASSMTVARQLRDNSVESN